MFFSYHSAVFFVLKILQMIKIGQFLLFFSMVIDYKEYVTF